MFFFKYKKFYNLKLFCYEEDYFLIILSFFKKFFCLVLYIINIGICNK